MANEKGTTTYALQRKFQSMFGFTLPLFHGRGLLNCVCRKLACTSHADVVPNKIMSDYCPIEDRLSQSVSVAVSLSS